MVKKLQRRFILISVISVATVLVLIMGSINIINYRNVLYSAKMRLDMLENGGGKAPVSDIINPPPLSPEAPFDSRYFSVLIEKDGRVAEVDMVHIAAMDTENAIMLASKLYEAGKTDGISGKYVFRAIDKKVGTLYVFLDHSRELDTFYSFLYSSVFISLFTFIAVFIFILIMSRSAVRPVAESYEKQKRFITDAGHELKTPLAVIKAANEVIAIENGASKWTLSIDNQVDRLSSLTNNLILLSKMGEDNGLVFESFSLNEVLNECIYGFEAVEIWESKTIKTHTDGEIYCFGDKNAIARLISILLDNALKYSPCNSTVDIFIKKNGRGTEITVHNPAEGIPTGNNNILFERFYRHDESRDSKKGGHGIGLSVAKAITDAHKGKISAKSVDGKSFTVTVIL